MYQTEFDDSQYRQFDTPNICAVCHAPSIIGSKFVVSETKFAKLPVSTFIAGKTKRLVEVKLCTTCKSKLVKYKPPKSAAKSYQAQIKAGQMELFNV